MLRLLLLCLSTVLLFGHCKRPATPPAPAAALEPVIAEKEVDLEDDGSLDSLLDLLTGGHVPVFDTTFLRLNPDEPLLDTVISGQCRRKLKLRYPGWVIRMDAFSKCPPDSDETEDAAREQVKIVFNRTTLYPAGYRYENNGDSVVVLDFFECSKMRFGADTWLVGQFWNPGCTGSFCMYGQTLLAKLADNLPEFYFFEHYPWPGVFADSDDDGRLEWLEMSFGDWHRDTVDLTVRPYELDADGHFAPMTDAQKNPYQALIRFDNEIFAPQHAHIVEKYWPR